MKLSEKQREIIKLLRETDCEIFSWFDSINHCRRHEVSNCDDITINISHQTWRGLVSKGLLPDSKPYHLTELGKTIEL